MSLAFEKSNRRFPAPLSLACALALAAPFGAGCSSDDDEEPDTCAETDLLPANFRPVDTVAEPELDVATTDGVTVATIDATAGGFVAAGDNPFIYIDLEAGEKVDISDVDALESDEWDIAFKRSTIRLNGGDSGPGGVGVVVVEGDFDDVTEAPDAEFAQDDWVSEDCALITERDQTPASAFHEWYAYDEPTMTLTPKPIVHVIQTRSGDHVKLVIDSYYDESGEMRVSAVYSVRWAPL